MPDASVSPRAAAGGSPVTELQQALWAWKGHCVEGASALGARDVDAVDRAIAARDALQPRIAALVHAVRDGGGAGKEEIAAVLRLHQEASAADARLVSLVASERTRLQREIDALGRPNSSATAYGATDSPSPHRLDIVR